MYSGKLLLDHFTLKDVLRKVILYVTDVKYLKVVLAHLDANIKVYRTGFLQILCLIIERQLVSYGEFYFLKISVRDKCMDLLDPGIGMPGLTSSSPSIRASWGALTQANNAILKPGFSIKCECSHAIPKHGPFLPHNTVGRSVLRDGMCARHLHSG